MLSTIKGCFRLLRDAFDYLGCFRLSTEKKIATASRGGNLVYQLTGTCHRADHFKPKNPEEKSPKLSPKIRTKPVLWNGQTYSSHHLCLHVKLSLQLVIELRQICLSDTSLPDLESRSLKTHPKFWEGLSFCKKSTQKSGLWRQKTDPKSRHVPVHLSRGAPPWVSMLYIEFPFFHLFTNSCG